MAIHRFERNQEIQASPEACWAFFSDPRNLEAITPPDLGFTVLSELPPEVYEGLFISYRVKPLLGIAVTWGTEITRVRKPFYFCDEQRVGPYALWHHEHFIEPLPGGRLRLRDVVHYVLPFAPLGDLLHAPLVRPRLEEIFAYRSRKIAQRFPG